MSGKSYTMKEMKAIVEYLTEHRAYSEIKGRKMWMDLASSKVTNRTWQSLKETFLKRILPDIHNPYYKLTITQISSFRQGKDIETRLNNRLQIRSTSKDSTDDVTEKHTQMPGNSDDIIEEKLAGEDPTQSNLRASTETLVLENCYETAEEIMKDLQSSTGVEEDKEPQATKSMRDLLTYSEPLTPMLQSVIDDFVTDDEEPKMQIVETEPDETADKNVGNERADNVTIEISDSEGNDIQEEMNHTKTTNVDPPSSPDKNKHAVSSKAKETEVTTEKPTALLSETKDTTNEKDRSEVKNTEGNNAKSSSEITQNNSASMTDTLLPGNQEAFEDKIKTIPEKRNLRSNKNTILENGRKRARSQDAEPKTKKRIMSKLKSISDSERSVPTNGNVFEKSKFSTLKQPQPEENIKASANLNNEKCNDAPITEETVEDSQDTVMKSSAEIENPCLKNVSLYAEQFSTEKYIDSDTSNNEDDKNKKLDRNKENENKEDENNLENETTDKNIKGDNRSGKTGDENKKGDSENVEGSDKIEDTVNKTKKIGDKKLEDKNKKIIIINSEDGNDDYENASKNKKKIEINEKAQNKIEKIEHKSKQKIDNNNKTHDINRTNDEPSSTAGELPVHDNDDNDVVMLKSHSDCVTDSGNEVRKGRDRLERQQRDRALANMFGFASGGTSRRQRRSTNRRKRTTSHSHKFNYGNMSSASSDWTSDTGSEYVSSPPRQYARKGRHTRKYLKPRSAPILSLEEEGGLFVMYNKKIYPVVKDGKIVKNYVTYTPEDDFDQEESFWKLKYVEEKKKTAELTKLINQAKEKEQKEEPSRVPPILPTTAQNSNALAIPETTIRPESTHNAPESMPAQKVQEPNPTTEEKKTVKIKFIKNNEEVQLEGHWSQLNPVLAHVAQLFQKDPDPVSLSCASSKTESLAPEPIVESGRSTPIEEVVEKVNRREQEIAQEIEKLHKEEMNPTEKPPQTQNNVTKRKGRPRKTSPAVPPSPTKIAKLDAEVPEETETTEKMQKAPQGENKINSSKGRPRKTSPAVPPSLAKIAKLDAEVPEETETTETMQKAPQGENKTNSSKGRPRKTSPAVPPSLAKIAKLDAEVPEETETTETMQKGPKGENKTNSSKGRPRKTSPAVPPSPGKIANLDAEFPEETETLETMQKAPQGENKTTVTTRRTRTPRKLLAEAVNQNNVVRTRRSTSNKSLEKTVDITKQTDANDPDADIRYKFPSPPSASRKSYANKTKTNAAAKNTSPRNTKSTTDLRSSPDNKFFDSIESTQGYQDSDISPTSICAKKRRKTSLSFPTHRKRYTTRYHRNDHSNDLITSDSSNSFQSSSIKTMNFQNSTITSEIYRSESYRLLMNNDPKHRNTSKLGRIVEASFASKDFDVNMEACHEIATNDDIDLHNKENMELLRGNTEDTLSNISLPTSPVLSIVENISISKTLLSSMDFEDYPSDDKQENENGTEQITLNALMTPDVDVTMPLMEQDCGIEKSRQDGKAYHYNMSISKTDAAISESLLNNIDTVNIQDPSLTETLNVKLKNLLLDSAKKLSDKNTVKYGPGVELKDKPGPKKTNCKKRSSTPRKRQTKRKQSLTNNEPGIIEEHVESCSRAGPKSCPPIILVSEHNGDELITHNEAEFIQTLTIRPTRGRKKKDVIKIKITKPKSKIQDNYKQNNKTNFTDSGINDTESEIQILQISDDSVDLIHNHSDTCLNAHECMGDSVKILENSADSILSLDSNTAHSDIIVRHHTVGNISDNQELFSTDAQDGSDEVKEFDFVEPRHLNSAATTVYHTPIGTQSSPNSLMTDDLSDEIPEEPVRNTDWYLYTEDEYSNTNCYNNNKNSEAAGYGAQLEQIFPLTCAVPDLSTITEMSRENGDSKKFTDDTNTRDAFNSPSLFD